MDLEIEWGVAGIALVLWGVMMTLFITGFGFGTTWYEVLGLPMFILVSVISLPAAYFIVLLQANR